MLMLLLILLGVATRLVPHLSQFTAILAAAMLAGLYAPARRAIGVTLVTMLISDIVLGFHDTMLYTYTSMFLITGIGLFLKTRKNFANVLTGSLVSAIVFFLITNFGAFLSLYPHTWAGLRECYIMAIPFFKTTLASTIAYSLVLYAGFEWVLKYRSARVVRQLF